MTTTTKVVAWVGAVFGTISIAVLALLIGAMTYAGHKNSEQQRQQQEASTQLKQGLSQDLTTLSQTQVKPMTGDDVRKWLSGANSPTPTPGK
jgi:hypothetical protein